MPPQPAPPAPLALTDLPEADRQAALGRLYLLQPHLEAGVPLTQVAHSHGLELRTLQRWLRAYRLAGLTRKPRRDQASRTLPGDLLRLIESLALRSPRPTAAAVQRQATTVAQVQGWPVPCSSTVYAIIRALDPALTTLAHDGAKADAFDLIYRRTASRPNELWQADHTPLDL